MTRLPAWARSLSPDRGTLRQDAVAGVPGAIARVPDGRASAVLVGVNPVYGLYASMAGPIGGGVAVSTRLMVVTTTTAAALAAGSTLGAFSGADRSEALFVLSAPLFGGRNPYARLGGDLLRGTARSIVFAWVVVRLAEWLRTRGLRLRL